MSMPYRIWAYASGIVEPIRGYPKGPPLAPEVMGYWRSADMPHTPEMDNGNEYVLRSAVPELVRQDQDEVYATGLRRGFLYGAVVGVLGASFWWGLALWVF